MLFLAIFNPKISQKSQTDFYKQNYDSLIDANNKLINIKLQQNKNSEIRLQIEIQQLLKEIEKQKDDFEKQKQNLKNELNEQKQIEIQQINANNQQEKQQLMDNNRQLSQQLTDSLQLLEESKMEMQRLENKCIKNQELNVKILQICDFALPNFTSNIQQPVNLQDNELINFNLEQLQKIIKVFKDTFKQSKKELQLEVNELKMKTLTQQRELLSSITDFQGISLENQRIQSENQQLLSQYQQLKQLSNEQLQIMEQQQQKEKSLEQQNTLYSQQKDLNQNTICELQNQLQEQRSYHQKLIDKVARQQGIINYQQLRIEQLEKNLIVFGCGVKNTEKNQNFESPKPQDQLQYTQQQNNELQKSFQSQIGNLNLSEIQCLQKSGCNVEDELVLGKLIGNGQVDM